LKMKMKIFFLNENFPFFLKRKMKIFLSFWKGKWKFSFLLAKARFLAR
jgi:hypothetical protein